MADYVAQDLNLRLAGQPWTSAKASADAENLLAVAEGAIGAPRIQTAAIQNSAVVRAKLGTATNSISGTLAAGFGVPISLDPYSFFPSVSTSVVGDVVMQAGSGSGSATPDAPSFYLKNTSSASRDYFVAWRYITA